MRLRLLCFSVAAMLGVVAALTGPALAGECAPARVGVDPASLPGPWRQALDALLAATAREGQPWSCPDARVTLRPPGDHGLAQLEVEDASGVRRRPVASPDDVVPLGEAMLARTIVPVPPRAGAPPPGDPPRESVAQGAQAAVLVIDGAGRAAPLPQPFVPRPFVPRPFVPAIDGGEAGMSNRPPGPHSADLLISALVGTHYTGPTSALLVGPELRIALVFGRWSAGLMARYDAAVKVFSQVPDQFSLDSVSIGIPGGFRLLSSPVELVAEVEPTLAVVLMGALRPGQSEPDIDTKVDMRLGARFSAAVPLTRALRGVAAIGAEGVPEALFEDRHSRRKALPELPGYLIGFSVGVELGINR
jgi:hypothetical protein